jgi:K+-transporting ATPase ATPase C chain
MRTFLRLSWASLRLLLVLTVVLGLAYPLVVLGIARLVPQSSDGSLLRDERGAAVGSRLLGQPFEGDEWFLPRPSAAGEGYDPLASGASNLGPENEELLAAVEQRRAEIAAREGVDPDAVPADAVTASGSGLDPHISPEYARLQVSRVAQARGLREDDVADLVERQVRGPDLGFVGAPTVNVLELNLALDGFPVAGRAAEG